MLGHRRSLAHQPEKGLTVCAAGEALAAGRREALAAGGRAGGREALAAGERQPGASAERRAR